MKKTKISKKIIVIIIFVFMLFNVIWLVNFKAYSEHVNGYEKIPKIFIKKDGDYTLAVKKPRYLSFTGNFAITYEDISIIIWPELFVNGEYEYGLTIYDSSISHGYMFYIDSEFNYLDVTENNFSELEVKTINELLEKNAEELSTMNQIAIKEWNLGSEKSE